MSEIYRMILECLSGRVLEIGCGSGRLTDFLNEKGLDATGLDPYAYGSNCIRAYAEELPFDDGEFDSIVSVKSLHHTEAPEALREALRVLKKGGRICIADWVFGAQTGIPERYFTHDEIRKMLSDAGFRSIEFMESPERDIFIVRAIK